MITVVGGTKGGSGKSTIATNLACMLSAAGRDVLLVDTDDQEIATDFTNLRNTTRPGGAGYTCVTLTRCRRHDRDQAPGSEVSGDHRGHRRP